MTTLEIASSTTSPLEHPDAVVHNRPSYSTRTIPSSQEPGQTLVMAMHGGCSPSADDAFGPAVKGCRDDFDFTLRFEQYFFVIAPSVAMLLAGLARLYDLHPQRRKLVDALTLKWSKVVSDIVYILRPRLTCCPSIAGGDCSAHRFTIGPRRSMGNSGISPSSNCGYRRIGAGIPCCLDHMRGFASRAYQIPTTLDEHRDISALHAAIRCCCSADCLVIRIK